MKRAAIVANKHALPEVPGYVSIDLHHHQGSGDNFVYTSAFISIPAADAAQFAIGEKVVIDFTPERLIANGALLPTLWQRVLSFLGLR